MIKMIDLNQVLTFTEAAEKWGLAGGNTIRQAVLRDKFEGYEIKKSGTVWLTTYDAMYRVFGEPKETAVLTISQTAIFKAIEAWRKGDFVALDLLRGEAQVAFSQQKQIYVTEAIFSKEKTIYIFATLKEFETWLALMQRY